MAKRRKKRRRISHKKDAHSYLQEALMLLRQGDLKAAFNVASQVSSSMAQAAEREQARAILAETQFRQVVKIQNPLEKLPLIESALKASPGDIRLRFQRGIASLQANNAAEAAKEFDLVAKSEPEREGLQFLRQLAHLANKKPLGKGQYLSEAERNTLKLLEEFQKRPSKKAAETASLEPVLGNDSRMWTILLNMRQNKTFSQAETFQKRIEAYKQQPVSGILQYYSGLAAMREEQPDMAYTFWQTALSKGFTTKWCQKNVGLSMRQEFLEFVKEKQWNKIVNTSHRLPSSLQDESINQIVSLALFHLGYEQAEKDKWTQAVKYWQEAAKKANNRYLAQNMALAQEKLGKWEQAAQSWKDMLRRRPRKEDHPDYLTDKQVSTIWEHLADCYYNDYKDYDAIEGLRKAIQYAPDNIALRFKLISALAPEGHGDSEVVIKELKNILDIEPENIDALTQLAHYYADDWRYDALPLWKEIVELDPDNKEARTELAQSYIDKAQPEKKQQWLWGKPVSYKEQLAILQEGLGILPDHPDLIVALGIAHMDAGKKKLAKERFVQAYQLAPQNPDIASWILQNLIHLKENTLIKEMIPEIQKIPNLLPGFWVDQGKTALDHPGWTERFFEAALEQADYTDHATKASALVDIYMSIPPEQKYQKLRKTYMTRIEQEVPQSGAVEYIEAFMTFKKTGNASKARRVLRKAQKLATAANESGILRQIQHAEQIISRPTGNFLDMMFGQGGSKNMEPILEEMEDMLEELERTKGKKGLEKMFEQMLEELGGLDDGPYF